MNKTEIGVPYFKSMVQMDEIQIMDKKRTKLFFYPISVNLIDIDMGPPLTSVKPWDTCVKVSS